MTIPGNDDQDPETARHWKIRKEICDHAMSCVGTPYEYGCSAPGKGFDCATFGLWPYKKAGLIRPGTTPPSQHRDWIHHRDADPNVFRDFILQFANQVLFDDRLPADLVTFYLVGNAGKKIESHVGILLFDDTVVHAVSEKQVKRQRLLKVPSLCAVYRAKGLIDGAE